MLFVCCEAVHAKQCTEQLYSYEGFDHVQLSRIIAATMQILHLAAATLVLAQLVAAGQDPAAQTSAQKARQEGTAPPERGTTLSMAAGAPHPRSKSIMPHRITAQSGTKKPATSLPESSSSTGVFGSSIKKGLGIPASGAAPGARQSCHSSAAWCSLDVHRAACASLQ
jgi:hypothetical protein